MADLRWSKADVKHDLAVAVTAKAQAVDDVVQRLILIDSLNDRIDVLLGRLSHSREAAT